MTTSTPSANPFSYPKSRKPFSPALFARPSAEYRGAPLWSWNDRLETDRLLRQVDSLSEMGMGGFTMHCRVGLDTEYMGQDFLEATRKCAERAAEKDMLACLYDDDRWPSGCAGGLVTRDNPEFGVHHILLTPWKYGHGQQPPHK